MKKFSSKTKANSRLSAIPSRRLITTVVVLSILLYGLLHFRNVTGQVLSWVASPIYSARHFFETSRSAIPTYIRSRSEVEHTIQTLRQQIESEHGMRIALETVIKENEELKALLGATSTPEFLAGVLARPPFTPYDTLIIDRGAQDGIVSGAPVYYGYDRALGYVRVVYPTYSLVTLFSSPNVESTVYVYGPNIFTKAYGEGGGTIRVSVPQGVSLHEGDIVVLPSIDRGILGSIHAIRSVPTEPEQSAYIAFDAPLQSIHFVRVGAESVAPKDFDDALLTVREVEKTLFTFEVPQDVLFGSTSTSTMATGTSYQIATTTSP